MPEINLESLTKTYPIGVRAVDHFDLHIATAEFVVLVGPSGCGKTTTLRLIAGLEEPSSGTVRIDGRSMAGVPAHERGVGLVFQRPALYPHRNVRDNLGFALRLARTSRAKRASVVAETVRLLELDDILDRYPAELSGGQQQRVALGRALARRPRIVLLDEPLSNLDMPARVELRRLLKTLHHQLPTTIIHVTHDPVEAMALADRLAVMNEGRLQQVGKPSEVYERPCNRFVAGFLGWPAMNLVDGRLVAEEGRLRFSTGNRNGNFLRARG